MIVKIRRFIPLVIILGLFGAGWKARQEIQQRVVPTSDIPVDFTFVERTEKMGIHFQHEDPVLDLKGNTRMVFYIAGAAVADFNSDGWMDILLVNSKPQSRSHLYLNEKGRYFREASDPWGLAPMGEGGAPTSPVVLDFDNDGRPDLFVGRLGCALLFRNTGTRFEKIPLEDCDNSAGAVPVDVNEDGLLDLYVIRNWPAIDYFNIGSNYPYPDLLADAVNGGINQLFLNKGTRFERASDTSSGGDSHWSIDAAVGRLSPEDKFLRIYTANDYGRDSLLAIREGGLSPDHQAKMPFERRSGMSVSFGDLDGSGFPHIYVSNIYTPEYNIQENFLWKMINGKLVDQARTYRAHACGWAWGSAFADFNLDGQQDLYVANGMITGESTQEYSYISAVNMALPDVVRRSNQGWPLIGDRSLSGRQTDCLLLNTPQGFVNVARQVGIRDHWDGRAAALIDIDNNGALDLLVTVQEGKPHLFYNTINPGKRWVGFQLMGRKSNRDGVGARIEVRQKGRSLFRWGTGGRNGAMASSDPRLHFGLASDDKITVEIQWPSGITQNFGDVEPGHYYHIDELASDINRSS